MTTVIMAGGKGTRIASVNSEVPKPMIPILGKPILQYQIEYLKKNNLLDIIIVTGYLGDVIKEYFKDGSQFGVHINYYNETEPLGTAGALFLLSGKLSDDFLLLHGDIIFNIDFERFLKFHKSHNALASLVSHPNSHPYDSALLVCDNNYSLTKWITKEEEHRDMQNLVNAGIHIINKELLVSIKKQIRQTKVDLDRDVLKPSLHTMRIFAYNTPEYIKDMGTPDRFLQTMNDLKNNIPSLRCLENKQRAVFLDRDGTINKENGFVKTPEEFTLIPGTAAAIKKLNDSGFLVIVITNQPVIARGECSFETLKIIHNKMETELGKDGAYVNDIFFCPHHPDKGFQGEVPELKISCECRKPKPGMILEAAKKYNIDLSKSWMVGDCQSDILCGRNAGCNTAFLSDDINKQHYPDSVQCNLRCNNLLDFVNSISLESEEANK